MIERFEIWELEVESEEVDHQPPTTNHEPPTTKAQPDRQDGSSLILNSRIGIALLIVDAGIDI